MKAVLFLLALGSISLIPMTDIPTKPGVAGVFVGRTPCQEVARALKQAVASDCFKLKWKLTLYQDAQTHRPTTYRLEGTPYRQQVREGNWVVTTGTKTDPKATVYQLDPDRPDQSVYLQKGDDNVLFFLDKDRQLLIGNADFGYTLNRVSQ